MKFTSVALGVAFLSVAVAATPVSAGVSAETRKAYEKAADNVRPALRADEREAFIANCLADATAKGR
jgi:hypothetical protein